MTGPSGPSLVELLHEADPDVDRIVDTFVTRFNAAYGNPGQDRWDITKEDWQRYAFLGDRVLELIVAQTLFVQRDTILGKGQMTKILNRVVSNRALDTVIRGFGNGAAIRLVPGTIAATGTYGERITGSAFEAFIGALYCEVGLDDVLYFVNAILAGELGLSAPDENAIGALQEYFQKRHEPAPVYREKHREGADHVPRFTYQVLHGGKVLGEGTAKTKRLAQQEAARKALAALKKRS